MTAPSRAILTDEEWLDLVRIAHPEAGRAEHRVAVDRLSADRNDLIATGDALRAKLAERDRLLALVVSYLKHPGAGDNWDDIIKAIVALEGGPR